jgi:hypothetical protein
METVVQQLQGVPINHYLIFLHDYFCYWCDRCTYPS